MELILTIALTHLVFCSPRPPLPAAFPSPLGCRSLGHEAFAPLQVLLGRPTTRPASLPTSLEAYKVADPGATREPNESSWGHVLIFRTVPPANTLIRWVNENAFAPIVRARPCPTFGRPVHHGDGSPRLRPGTSPHALRIPPRGGHPALWCYDERWLRSPLAVSGFRLRARIGFSIPSAPRPARHYPRLWIRRPSFGRRRDLNPPDHALPSTHYAAVRTPHLFRGGLASSASRRGPHPRKR